MTTKIDLDRSTYLGSSDISAVIGLSPWKTPFAVWEAKVFGVTDDEPEDEERTKRLRRGTRFEPVILDQYQEETGAWIVDRNRRYIHPVHPFLAAEVDAEERDEATGEVTNLEIKSVSAFAAGDWGPSGTEEVPAHYAAQTQYALMVTGRKRTKIVCLIGTDDLRVYPIERNDAVCDYLLGEALSFWENHVQSRIAPPPVNGDDAERMIAKCSGLTVAATPETYEAARRLQGVKAALKRLEAAESLYGDQLRMTIALSMAGVAQTPKVTALVNAAGRPLVTWNQQECSRVDVKRLRKMYPDVAEECTATTTTRVLLLKGKNL